MKRNRVRTTLVTAAAVIGVGLGSYGLAAAASADNADKEDRKSVV